MSPAAPSPIARAGRDQREAADTGASVWVGASAGTGKTKVLTDRVLGLLLGGTEPQRVLCLTFTRAAAAEMANRILEELGRWAVAPEKKLIEGIEKLSGEKPGAESLSRARRLFGAVLDCPGGLKVQTIHAFCESLLRRFPVEAGVQPHFQLMDERTSWELLAGAREEVLARALDAAEETGGDPRDRLARALADIAGRIGGDRFQGLARQLANARGRIARLLERRGGLNGADRAIARLLDVAPGETVDSLVAGACADSAFDGPGLRRALAVMAEGQKTDRERAARMAPFLAAAAAERPDLLHDYRRGLLSAKGEIFERPITKGALDGCDDGEELLGILAAEGERMMALDSRLRSLDNYRTSVAALTLGAVLVEAYEAHKQALARLDYDDLILKTRGLLEASGAAAWVLFKLDGGIDHILVDEAQDTSPDQWGVIGDLAQEFFSGAGAREETRTVFAVGDAKQSIYSFQRADPRAFEEMREFFRARAEAAAARWRDVDLHVSFRSTAAVLGAVDAVFARAESRDGLGPPGAEISHQPAREGQAGLVELWPPLVSDKPSPADPWAPADEPETGFDARARLARLIAATIGGWIADGEILESKGRPIRPGDIMVLMRTRTGFVDDLVRRLKQLGVPVAGVDRRVLTEELAVMDLVALGRFALLPEDDLNLASVLKGPFVGLGEDELFTLAFDRSGTLWRALTEAAREGAPWAAARDRLGEVLGRADRGRPFEFYAAVLDRGGGRERLLGRLGREAADPVDEFLELALAYERTAAPSLQGFLAWLEAGRAEIKRDLERAVRDEVRVMTVHGAKGLEAPVVILPDTMQRVRAPELPYWATPATGSGLELPLWAPRIADFGPRLARLREETLAEQRRESHRLLYVAMTRAEDRLYVCGWQGARKPPEGCWYELVKAGLEAAPGVKRTERDFPAVAGFSGPVLSLASPQTAKPEERRDEAAPPRPALDTSWAEGPPAAEPDRPRPLAPSDPGEAPPAASPAAGGARAFLRGRIVHALLQHLPGLDPGARAAAARRYLARPALGLAAAERNSIAAETLAVLDEPGFAELFAPNSLAEVPLTGAVAGAVVSGQVDRLAVTDREVVVVDYKSGRHCPESPERVPPAYLRQMALYRALLRGAMPRHAVRCALVFTAGPRLLALPDFLLDEVLETRHRPA